MKAFIILLIGTAICLFYTLSIISQLKFRPQTIRYSEFCTQYKSKEPFDNLLCKNDKQHQKFIMFMFDSFSFDMIKKFIYEDFNFPIYEKNSPPTWLKPNVDIYRYHSNLSKTNSFFSQYYQIFTGSKPKHAFSNLLDKDNIFSQLKQSNYQTYYIGDERLPLDIISELTHGMRLYEDPEDFPFEYLCEEDYEIETNEEEEEGDSEDEFQNYFIKSHQIPVDQKLLDTENEIEIQEFIEQLEEKIQKKLKMSNIGPCLDQITNGFQTNVIYFSRILQKYQQQFGKDHIITQKTSIVIEKTLKVIMEFLNSHPEYVVFVLGVPIRDVQKNIVHEKASEQQEQEQEQTETVFEEFGTATHDLNKKKKFKKVTIDQHTIKKEMHVQKEKIDPNDELSYNSSGFLFTYRPDSKFSDIVSNMKIKNSLIADSNDLKYLFDIKEQKINSPKQSEARKYPKLKKRPEKTISNKFLKSFTRVENKLYNIQPQQTVQIFAEQLENINLPLETEDFDKNMKFNFTFTDEELVLAMRRTEIQLQYQIQNHPFSSTLAKETSEFEPIQSDWQRQLAEAHSLEDLQTIVNQDFIQQYKSYLNELQQKVKVLNQFLKEKLGITQLLIPVVLIVVFGILLLKEFVL